MNTYKLLLDEIYPYLNNSFIDLSVSLQKRISTVGMGEETRDIHDGAEEVEWVYIEAEQRYFVDEEAEKNKEGGIKKSKGIRPRLRTECFYIWDRLLPLEREYKVAKYDFENYPGHREEAASKKLAETIKPYLEIEFSNLPQPLKMNIAYVDNFMIWNKEDIRVRESLAQLFDIRMLPDSEPGFLIGRYGIRNVWAKYAKKHELLAEEAIPLMNGLDPESWQEHTINQKGLPKDMVDSSRRCLKIAGAEGLIKDYPRKWLEWGCKHDLNKPIIRSDERVPEPNICMFAFFEAAVNEHIKEVPLSPDSNRLEDHELLEKVLPKLVQQENAILKYLNSNGYDPLNLPAFQQGKESVKKEVREHFQKNPSLFTSVTFEKAWQRLLDCKQLAYISSP